MAHPNEVATRTTINLMVRELWLTFANAVDDVNINSDFLTDEDLNIWTAVTAHPAIQDRLAAGIIKKKNG